MKEPSTPERTGYSPQGTQLARCQAVRDVVSASTDLLVKAPVRIDLNDTAAVKEICQNMLHRCADAGILPSVELLSASLGISRRYFYKYINDHPDHETTAFFDQMRTAFTAARISAVDRGAASESVSIFLMLNSQEGYTNEHRIQIDQSTNPLETADPAQVAAIRARYVSALPEE